MTRDMSATRPLRVAIVGTAARSEYLYGPLAKALPEEATLVAVWPERRVTTRRLGRALRRPRGTADLRGGCLREAGAEIAIVSVAYNANGAVGFLAVEQGLHVLLETPYRPLAGMRRTPSSPLPRRRGLRIEVAEQFHRRPQEQIKLRLIASGIFGTVYSAFNDFAGHGYHGVSVLRSYLGFDAVPVRVTGAVRDYQLAPHWSRLAGTTDARTETQEHGIIEFADGRLGIYHWTNVAYDSALRWWRSSRFLAEKGMGITTSIGLDSHEQLTLLAPGGEAPRTIVIERRWERTDGGALVALVAHTGDPELPIVRWDSPFRSAVKGQGPQWHDDEIGVASCLLSLFTAVREGTAPSYGAAQARLDQEIIVALHQSSLDGGRPVQLPLDPATQIV